MSDAATPQASATEPASDRSIAPADARVVCGPANAAPDRPLDPAGRRDGRGDGGTAGDAARPARCDAVGNDDREARRAALRALAAGIGREVFY